MLRIARNRTRTRTKKTRDSVMARVDRCGRRERDGVTDQKKADSSALMRINEQEVL